jgi:hypothetical protein
MNLRSQNKIPLLLLSACIVFSVVFTVVLAADSHDHDCIGEDCPVCAHIEAAQSFLKTLKLAGIGLVLALCSIFSALIYIKDTNFFPCCLSPVMLKVRFNS